MANDVVADAALAGGARAGGYDEVVGVVLFDLIDGDLVVAVDLHPAGGVDFTDPLDQVVGERVVVVDEDDHGQKLCCRRDFVNRGGCDRWGEGLKRWWKGVRIE